MDGETYVSRGPDNRNPVFEVPREVWGGIEARRMVFNFTVLDPACVTIGRPVRTAWMAETTLTI